MICTTYKVLRGYKTYSISEFQITTILQQFYNNLQQFTTIHVTFVKNFSRKIPYERFSIMILRSDSEHLSDFTGADSEIHYFEDAHEKFTTIYNNLQQWTWCGTRKWGLTKKIGEIRRDRTQRWSVSNFSPRRCLSSVWRPNTRLPRHFPKFGFLTAPQSHFLISSNNL